MGGGIMADSSVSVFRTRWLEVAAGITTLAFVFALAVVHLLDLGTAGADAPILSAP